MEFSTKEGIDVQVYTYTGYNSKEPVLGITNAQRNNRMG